MLHEHALGQFEFKMARVQARFVEGSPKAREKVPVSELTEEMFTAIRI